MMDNYAIGFLELNSIAKGYEVADAVLKAADIRLIFAKESCPGKYIILFCGQVASVNASLKAGTSIAGHLLVDMLLIPKLHTQVLQAIWQTSTPVAGGSLGVMEFFCIAAAVSAADRAVKAADISLLSIRLGIGIGGKSFVTLTGDVAAVKEAVEAGVSGENVSEMLVGSSVITSPSPELLENLY